MGNVPPATPSVSRSSTQAAQPRRPGARKPPASSSNPSTEAKLRLQLAALTAENKQLKQLKVQAPSATSPAMEIDGEGSDCTHAALQADIDQARTELQKLQNCDDHVKALIPDYEGKVAAANAKVDAATAAKRAAHPLKKQMEHADGRRGKLTKKVADAKLAVEARREESQKAQVALQTQEAALAELQEALGKADTEIAELAARLASEHAAAAPSAPGVGHAHPASGHPAPGDTAPVGFISIAEASARWEEAEAEREQINKLLSEQLNKLLSDPRLQLPPADDVSVSELQDLGAIEDLETSDDAWSKVDRAKRKAVLHRSRDKMARDIHAGISGVIKASSKKPAVSSLFKKR